MTNHTYRESGAGFCGICDDMPGEGVHGPQPEPEAVPMSDKKMYELFGTIAYAETPEERDEAQDTIYDYLRDLEGKVGKVRELAEKMAALCPPDDWPESGSMADAALADTGRGILVLLDTTEEKE